MTRHVADVLYRRLEKRLPGMSDVELRHAVLHFAGVMDEPVEAARAEQCLKSIRLLDAELRRRGLASMWTGVPDEPSGNDES